MWSCCAFWHWGIWLILVWHGLTQEWLENGVPWPWQVMIEHELLHGTYASISTEFCARKTVLLAEPASLRGSQPTGKDHLHGLHVQDPHVFTVFYCIICMLHGSSRKLSIWFDCSRQANPSQHFREVLHGWTWLLWSACRNNGCANAAVPCSNFIDYID